MGRWHNIYLNGHVHFCTFTVVGWEPLLTDGAPNILYEEWEAARKELNVRVLAYVIMPNHVHMMLLSTSGENMSRFLQRTMSLTSRRIKPGGGRFWKERPRVLPVHSPTVLRAKVDYLHNNPVRKHLVECPDEWPHSSLRQFACGEMDLPFVCDSWEGVRL
ncbi:MAG: transposase [Armatimonadota bacterium]